MRQVFGMIAISSIFFSSMCINLSPVFASSYSIVKYDEDADFLFQGKRIVRKGLRIRVPSGMSSADLTRSLQSAAWSVYDKFHPNAVMVFAYRQNDSVDGSYTAGRCILAPNGRWEDAKLTTSRSQFRTTVDLNPLYFRKPEKKSNSSQVKLIGHKFLSTYYDKIKISNSAESWGDEDTIARVPEGTTAKIIETKTFTAGSEELIRYRISVNVKGKTIQGWVFKTDVR